MELAITRLAVCPIRARPDDRSEMTSQLLFGERVEVLDRKKSSWIRVRCLNDDYEGWMDPKQIEPYTETSNEVSLCIEAVDAIFCDGETTYITMGAELPHFDGMTTTINDWSYRFSGQVIAPANGLDRLALIEKFSRKLLNTPYLWGGRSPLGIDCSGLTQIVYKCCGIHLPRDSKDQAEIGEMVDFLEQSRPGDLAFFTRESGEITHVGIVTDDRQVIHASGKVRVDALDHYGIYNKEIQEYTHRMKIIKRVV